MATISIELNWACKFGIKILDRRGDVGRSCSIALVQLQTVTFNKNILPNLFQS